MNKLTEAEICNTVIEECAKDADVALPPLPAPPAWPIQRHQLCEWATEYARAAVLADRQQCVGDVLDVDALANEIRRVDGNNSLGAGALAEALMPFLQAHSATKGENNG